MQTIPQFNDVLSAADGLSVDEQETLIDILRHRIAERRRKQLVRDIEEARREFAGGNLKPMTVQEIMDEIRS